MHQPLVVVSIYVKGGQALIVLIVVCANFKDLLRIIFGRISRINIIQFVIVI